MATFSTNIEPTICKIVSQPVVRIVLTDEMFDFVFNGFGKLSPKEDITPLESVQICMLLTYVLSCCYGMECCKFIKYNKLERHFTNV